MAAKNRARPAGPPRGSGGPSGFVPAAPDDAAHLDVTVRARPGASRTTVGGRYGDGEVLVVAVDAPAVDGRATEAVAAAVAAAFGLRRRDVDLRSGATSRTKILRLHGDGTALRNRLAGLLDGAG